MGPIRRAALSCACERAAFTRCGLCRAAVCGVCMGSHADAHAAEAKPDRSRHDGGFAVLQSTVRDAYAEGAPEGGDDGSRFFGGGGA